MSNYHYSLSIDAVPASPPQNVTATLLSSTQILVMWNEVPEIHQNGLIIMFEILYEPLITFGILVAGKNTTSYNSLSIILAGLQENLEYNISVRAYTVVGPGPYSVEITVVTDKDGKL